MAKSMKEVFGKHLFVPTTSDRKKELPSPEDLRGMIVVNAVRPSMRKRTLSMLESSKNLFSESSKEFSNNAYSKMFRKFNSKVERRSSRRLHDSGTFSVNYESTKSIKSVGGESEGDFKELTALFLFHEVNFSGYFLESMDQICSHMHDIKDTKVPMIVDMYSDNSTLWRKYNETHMTRIFPSEKDRDTSIRSTLNRENYNPVLAWSLGCQMTSLRFQQPDTDLAVNDGLFRQIGGMGYLEKPKWLLGEGDRPDPMRLKIRVISGSCIPKLYAAANDASSTSLDSSIDSPFVILELHDVVFEGANEQLSITKHNVKCGNGNGFYPIFDDMGKQFEVETPDVATLVFRIKKNSERGKDVSTTAVPVSCLRRGYRSVQLYDTDNTRHGRFASAALMVFIM